MFYHNLLGNIRTIRPNVNSRAKLFLEKNYLEKNCLRAVPARMQGCPAKLNTVSDKGCPHLCQRMCGSVGIKICAVALCTTYLRFVCP